MKNKLSFLAILMMAMALPQNVFAYDIYDFSAIAPTGQCLFYRILNWSYTVEVSAPCVNESWVGYDRPTGDLTIPDSVIHNGQTYYVTSIRGKAFENCTGLTSVTIPSSITSIGSRAFKDCIGLTSVTFNATNCTTASNNSYAFTDRAFIGCDSITVFTFGDNVHRIPMYLCAGLSNLTSITIPSHVWYINNNAFRECIGLHSVTFNAINCSTTATDFSKAPFYGCHGITVFSFGDSVQSIPNYLCAGGLSNLTSITIPNLITTIVTVNTPLYF